MLRELKKYLIIQRFIREMKPNKKTIFMLVGNAEISKRVQYIFIGKKYRAYTIANSTELEKVLVKTMYMKIFYVMVDSNYKKYFKVLEKKNFPLGYAVVLPIYKV